MPLNEDTMIVPTGCGDRKLQRLFTYFLYCAPSIDSIHKSILSVDKHEKVLDRIKKTHNTKSGEYLFCAHNTTIEDELTKQALNGDEICGKCKRFICKRTTTTRENNRKETDLECLLRHLRNSIAHGRVYVRNRGNYISICFEDRNKEGKITARIMCCRADLEKWRNILQEAVRDEKVV